jgi:hypothetical protein
MSVFCHIYTGAMEHNDTFHCRRDRIEVEAKTLLRSLYRIARAPEGTAAPAGAALAFGPVSM